MFFYGGIKNIISHNKMDYESKEIQSKEILKT